VLLNCVRANWSVLQSRPLEVLFCNSGLQTALLHREVLASSPASVCIAKRATLLIKALRSSTLTSPQIRMSLKAVALSMQDVLPQTFSLIQLLSRSLYPTDLSLPVIHCTHPFYYTSLQTKSFTRSFVPAPLNLGVPSPARTSAASSSSTSLPPQDSSRSLGKFAGSFGSQARGAGYQRWVVVSTSCETLSINALMPETR
jgi:hypothetical protein